MSHLRRVVSLLVLAVLSSLVVFGAIGAVSASASVAPASMTTDPTSRCC
ncbi:MAG: hypothetical protein JWR24_2097 [Actinoallomurus sp.]|jgi:hypothetical protein|nr:hypothetical protein [Actinoallomurus sp.]